MAFSGDATWSADSNLWSVPKKDLTVSSGWSTALGWEDEAVLTGELVSPVILECENGTKEGLIESVVSWEAKPVHASISREWVVSFTIFHQESPSSDIFIEWQECVFSGLAALETIEKVVQFEGGGWVEVEVGNSIQDFFFELSLPEL